MLLLLLLLMLWLFIYSPFHKTLPKSSLRMHWISVRFYEMGDSIERMDVVVVVLVVVDVVVVYMVVLV